MKIEVVSPTMVRVTHRKVMAFVRQRKDNGWEARFEGRWVMASSKEEAITKVRYVIDEISRQLSTSS